MIDDDRPLKSASATGWREWLRNRFQAEMHVYQAMDEQTTRQHLAKFKNRVMWSNVLANLIGAIIKIVIFQGGFRLPNPSVEHWTYQTAPLFNPLAAIVIFVSIYLYELPIRRYIGVMTAGAEAGGELTLKARQRLLNEPFFVTALNFTVWFLSGVVYALFFYNFGLSSKLYMLPLFVGLNTGLIISSLAFFITEHVVQHHLTPHFFPEGGLSKTPKTLKLRIAVRLAALFFACNIIPILSLMQLLAVMPEANPDLGRVPDALRIILLADSILFMTVGALLTAFVALNLSLPFHNIVFVLKRIKQGDFDQKVLVVSNDEIGYMGDAINEMTQELKERERMRRSLELAREIQQGLLPQSSPKVGGLDIAGRSIYCDETGGDYFDYLDLGGTDSTRLGVIVGDVSDHGLQSAMMMVSARAYFRHYTCQAADISEIAAGVNRLIFKDVADTGHFMTLFLLVIESEGRRIKWVRAGQDPGLLYDPSTKAFVELTGQGLPLGVEEGAVFQAQDMTVAPGQVIVLATDGLFESTDDQGERFGKTRLNEIVSRTAGQSAEEILEAIILALENFAGSPARHDDVTIVVIRITDQAGHHD